MESNTGESCTRAFLLLPISLTLPRQSDSTPLNNWLLKDWDPSWGTQVPAAKLMTLSFNTHSCLDRCVTTAQRSEEHTLFPLLVPPQYIPNTIRTLSLEGGGVSVYERLRSCLLLRTANVCSGELPLFKPWSEGGRRDGKSVSRQQWRIKLGTSELTLQDSAECLAAKTVHTNYFWSYAKKLQPFLNFLLFILNRRY